MGHAAQSLVLTNDLKGQFTIPSTAAYTSVPQWHLDLRVHDFQEPPGYWPIVQFPGLRITNSPSASAAGGYRFIDDADGTLITDVSFSGRTDILIRVTRDALAKRWYVETWNGDGSNYALSAVQTFATVISNSYSGAGQFGDTYGVQNHSDIAFLRWYTGIVPTNSAPPHDGVSDGDLLDWEFDNSSNSTQGVNIAWSSTGSPAFPVYVNTPKYLPYCNAGSAQSLRAGTSGILDGSASVPLNGSSTLNYLWTQLTGPSTVVISQPGAAQPQVTGVIAGTYTFQLTVTDSNFQSATCSVKHGAVNTDANGAVVASNPDIARIFGPLIQYGKSPWPYFDDRHKAMADLFGPLLATTFADVWNQASPGSVTVTAGSTAVSGAGTKFKTTYCNGGTAPSDPQGTYLIGWYPVGDVPGHFGRHALTIASCISDTQLTLSTPWDLASAANIQYATMSWSANAYYWISYTSGTNDVNYYDNVLAYYSLYLRSGIDDYQTYARTLADRWWQQPWLDEGRNPGQFGGQPRGQSLTGMFVRALDGRPDMWPGLRNVVDFQRPLITVGGPPSDLREDGYRLAQVALCGMLDPDPVHRSLCRTDVARSINTEWYPAQNAAGIWDILDFGYSEWNGWGSTVNVTTGSTVVTGTDTQWVTRGMCDPTQDFWTFNGPTDLSNPDSTFYHVIKIQDDTHLTLDRPYQGPTATGRGSQCHNVLGRGAIPYMVGVADSGLYYAESALRGTDNATADKAKAALLKAVDWIIVTGFRPATKGLWFARDYPNCEPLTEGGNPNCTYPSDPAGSRELSGQVINAITQAYRYTGDPKYAAIGDTFFGGIFGKSGGPSTDGIYSTGIDGTSPANAPVCNGGYYWCHQWTKYFGFFFGFGNDAAWPAARLGTSSSGGPPIYALGVNSYAAPSTAGNSMVWLGSNGPWTVQSNAAWLHPAATSTSGTGSAFIQFSFDANPSPMGRTGILTIAGLAFTVTQAGSLNAALCPPPALGAFTGCYYNNVNLSGNPVLARTDGQINFDWQNSSPGAPVPAQNYSVRWMGNFQFDAGTYVFTVMTSDGMRIYIDNNIVLDRWRDQPQYGYRVSQPLTQGAHLLTVEYYEATGAGSAHVSWQNTTPVTQPPVIASFSANPASIPAGQSAILTWSVSGATTVTLDNGIGDVSSVTSKTVTPPQTVTYKLTASNSAGIVSSQSTVTVTPVVVDTQPPTVPTLVSAIAKSATEVDLVWTASTDNVGVAGYQIFRNGSLLTPVSGTILSYFDKTVVGSTLYTYTVKAFDATPNYSAASNAISVTTPAPVVVAGACPAPAVNAFTGCYYNNTDLTGNPMLSRTDNQILFDWGISPDPALPPQNFSARWQGNFTLDPGDYTFSVITSDGMRLYVDGNLIIDRWRDQPPYGYRANQTLSAGTHLIVVEYYDRTGGATAHLTWINNTPVVQKPVISAFTANPVNIKAGQSSTLSWSVSGASSLTIDSGVGDVSALTSQSVTPAQTTTYKLTAVNGAGSVTATAAVTVATGPPDTQPPTIPTLTSAVAKSAGEVDLVWTASTDNVGVAGYQIFRNGTALTSVSGTALNYADIGVSASVVYVYAVKAYDAAGNYSALSNSISVTTPAAPVVGLCPAPATNAFTGCYYGNTDLAGNAALARTDSQIAFDWGNTSPDPSLPPQNFSARWQGNFAFDPGSYTFSVTTSDGIRIYIDGYPVLDRWRDQPPAGYRLFQTLSGGNHLIVVEYYERTGSATAHVAWQKN